MTHELDRVFIKDLEVSGIIGINPSERTTPQTIRVNAVLWVDSRRAAQTDDIDDAANYRTVAKAMIAHIEGGKPMLVERLAQELADLCFTTEALVQAVDITVEKPGAVRFAESVGISIHRSRVD